MMSASQALASSFRDPSGFVYRSENILYRQVNASYAEHYRALMDSGLYEELANNGSLIRHEEVAAPPRGEGDIYRILKPALIPFISYPYEWSFSQLKDAALLTLRIQEAALRHGLTLKDASAYNIQFVGAAPVFIDTLSFERYTEGQPWVAYQQFCQHFLAPLALMKYRDIRLSSLLRDNIGGVPLDLCSKLLPPRTWMRPGILMHIHLHARSQRRFADSRGEAKAKAARVSIRAMRGLLDHLKSIVSFLHWSPGGTEWADYYEATNYTAAARGEKETLVAEYISAVAPKSVWDFGANTGEFSRLGAQSGAYTVAFDIDASAVEKNYRVVRKTKFKDMLPLVLDLTNPSPSLGWGNQERNSIAERGPTDLLLALALVHHLAISNNVPLERIAAYFAACCSALVIEFVPKEDSQVRRLLATRKDIFPQYTVEGFEQAFSRSFTIERKKCIEGSCRTLYLMRKK
jgi:ribosomal protein L11 methylase PrmA